MSHYDLTFFLDSKVNIRGNVMPLPVLYVEPDGLHGGGCISFQLRSHLTVDEQLKVAERLANAVVAWRDDLASRAQQERSAVDELAEARAEIARLKAEAESGEDQ